MPAIPSGSADPSRAAGPLVVILAGGTSRRWGRRDKTAAPLAGRPVLWHVVDAVLPDAAALAVVAPADHPARAAVEAHAREAARPLCWTREDPPGGGPLAGLAAGLAALDRLGPAGPVADVDLVLALAGDLPFAATAWPRLVAAVEPAVEADGVAAVEADGVEAAVGVDPAGRRQPLLAAYRARALRRLARDDLSGRPMRLLVAGLRVVDVPVTAEEALDLDAPADAAAAARILARRPRAGRP